MTKFADFPWNQRRWRIAAAFIGLGGVSVFLAPPLLVSLANQRVGPLKHDFCVLKTGNPIFVDHGLGGSDLFLYDRKTKARHVVARTPYFEEEPSLAANDRQVVCTFVDPRDSSSGLEIIDIATGKVQTYLRGRFDGVTRPVFSPSGRRVVFTHYGRGWDAPAMSNGRGYLCELDLATGEVSDLVEKRAYYRIADPLYLDENHIAFFGELRRGEAGDSQSVLATWTRGTGIRREVAPDYLRLIRYSRTTDSFCALTQTRDQPDLRVAFFNRQNLNNPNAWRLTPLRCGYADYSPGTNEIFTLSENAHDDTINAVSLRSGKTTAVLTLPK